MAADPAVAAAEGLGEGLAVRMCGGPSTGEALGVAWGFVWQRAPGPGSGAACVTARVRPGRGGCRMLASSGNCSAKPACPSAPGKQARLLLPRPGEYFPQRGAVGPRV